MVSVKYKCDVCGVWVPSSVSELKASFTDDGALCDKCRTHAEIAEEAKRIDEVCFEVRLRGVDPDMVHSINRSLHIEVRQFEDTGQARDYQILMTHRSDKAEAVQNERFVPTPESKFKSSMEQMEALGFKLSRVTTGAVMQCENAREAFVALHETNWAVSFLSQHVDGTNAQRRCTMYISDGLVCVSINQYGGDN